MARPASGAGWFVCQRRRQRSIQIQFRWWDGVRQRVWYVGTLKDGATPADAEDLLLARVKALRGETEEEQAFVCELLRRLVRAAKGWEVFDAADAD